MKNGMNDKQTWIGAAVALVCIAAIIAMTCYVTAQRQKKLNDTENIGTIAYEYYLVVKSDENRIETIGAARTLTDARNIMSDDADKVTKGYDNRADIVIPPYESHVTYGDSYVNYKIIGITVSPQSITYQE